MAGESDKSVPISQLPTAAAILTLAKTIKEDRHLNDVQLPGLANLLAREADPNVDLNDTDFTLQLLKVFRDSDDQTYEGVLNGYTPNERELFDEIVAGKRSLIDAIEQYEPAPSLSARRALRLGQEAQISSDNVPQAPIPETHPIHHLVSNFLHLNHKPELPTLYNDSRDKQQIKVYAGLNYANWGRTVENTPVYTFVPHTSYGVAQIVKYAKQKDMGVRVSGFRHSWSPIFGRDNKEGKENNGDVLISTLEINDASKLPNFTSLPTPFFQPASTDLNSIALLDQTLPGNKRLVRVGTSTTNEQFRRWCKQYGKVTLPMNIIEVEITMGGSNAPICHGAGIRNKTLSDQVRGMEYVDANGEQREITDRDLLRAAAGCFGLIGVVTHLLLEVDPISCAVMRPQKLPVVDAIPPPPGFHVPKALQPESGWPRTPEQVDKAQRKFERMANEDDYSEWFWFPFLDKVWVNTWNTDPDTSNVVDFPDPTKAIFQVLGTITMNILQNVAIFTHTQQWWAHTRTLLISTFAMKQMSSVPEGGKSIRTLVPDALHFQRGVQNVRVRDLEVETPLTPKNDGSGSRNYLPVQQAWWSAIQACYDEYESPGGGKCPQRMPLEMRIMGDSDIIMAPQYGHKLGVCSIEILTLQEEADHWTDYAQGVLDRWTALRDAKGQLIPVRPHWAKEWKDYHVDGKLWQEKLKEELYKDQISEFKTVLEKIGQKDHWSMTDMRKRFSNQMLDYLFFQ